MVMWTDWKEDHRPVVVDGIQDTIQTYFGPNYYFFLTIYVSWMNKLQIVTNSNNAEFSAVMKR
jgi:hypothetical protein